ncbi:MAG TPA: hypothetical protein VH684_13865 [Xanthobacteraceae bacterium]|jgi:hypothetical protein
MLNPSNVDFCSEYHVFEKAIEVMSKIGGVDRRFRIEALHAPESVIPYSARCYVRINLDTTVEAEAGKNETVSVWAHYHLPGTAGESADEAIERALGYLRERSSM